MRRLHVQIYLAIVGVIVVFAILLALAWWIEGSDERWPRRELIAEAVQGILPAPEAGPAAVQAVLDRYAPLLRSDLTVRDPGGALVASAGEALSRPPGGPASGGWSHLPEGGWGLTMRLADGRWVLARRHRGHGARWLIALALLAVAAGVCAYPVARWTTRRLERLQGSVDALGAGDLAARVPVQGRDEVAALAGSFNRAAERIEVLVESQRGMLAAASHELRSPLARIRLAVEMLAEQGDPKLRERVARDVAELDDLIEELLLASRLERPEDLDRVEEVEILALAAEEGARVGAEVGGTPVTVRGDARLLRRLLRNLFENARRHGRGTAIAARVGPADGGAVLYVDDAGPGVPETERERIFEPFYRPAGTAEGEGGGVGLGLALVRRIARRHGGDATCRARAGGGTRFEVRLAAGRAREPNSGAVPGVQST